MMGKLCSPRSGAIEVVSFDGKQFVLRCAEPFAPGQPLSLTFELKSSHLLELKSLGSVRRDDVFEVRARAATLHKSTREALLGHFQKS
ncbi:MAG TPA: hypothetical protein VFX59_00275 [Polyangiales bacterium]|nr:hypothetical protein [Polyangiales bacterium]